MRLLWRPWTRRSIKRGGVFQSCYHVFGRTFVCITAISDVRLAIY